MVCTWSAHVFGDMHMRTVVLMVVREIFARLFPGAFTIDIMAIVILMMGSGQYIVRVTEGREESNHEKGNKEKRS